MREREEEIERDRENQWVCEYVCRRHREVVAGVCVREGERDRKR